MKIARLAQIIAFIALSHNFLIHCMSGDRVGSGPGITRGPHVPGLPTITADPQTDPAVAQAIENIAQSWRKKQENPEKRREESLEQPRKRRRKDKEEDTSEQPRPREPQILSTTIATTTTSTQPRRESLQGNNWTESELSDMQAISTIARPRQEESLRLDIWEEPEWGDVLQAIDQRTTRQNAEEYFREFLPNIEDKLVGSNTNLINTIRARFLQREITLDELNAGSAQSPYIVRLTVRLGDDHRITPSHIELIGQRFPNLRILYFADIDLGDTELHTLSEQPIASQLVSLIVGRSSISSAGIQASMPMFKKLISVCISGFRQNQLDRGNQGILTALAGLPCAARLISLSLAGITTDSDEIEASMPMFRNLVHLAVSSSFMTNQELAALARQPFASQLTSLHIDNNHLIDEAGIASMHTFTRLTQLNISGNNLGQEGLKTLAQQPFAPQLIILYLIGDRTLRNNQIPVPVLESSLRVFTNLRFLHIANNNLGNNGFAVIAAQPFAPHLMHLDVRRTGLTSSGFEANIHMFTSIINLNISGNLICSKGLAALARQPFASKIVSLGIANNNITVKGMKNSIRAFTSLRSLEVTGNFISHEDEGIEAIAAQPFASNLSLTFIVVMPGQVVREGTHPLPNTVLKQAMRQKYKNKFKLLNLGK